MPTPPSLDLTPKHEMLRQTARDFAHREVAPVAAHFDESGEFPRETIRKMGELGLQAALANSRSRHGLWVAFDRPRLPGYGALAFQLSRSKIHPEIRSPIHKRANPSGTSQGR